MNTRPVHVFVTGLKGATFLERLLDARVGIAEVVTYQQADDASNGFRRIQILAAAAGIPVIVEKRPTLRSDGISFVVGWQYLFEETAPNVIVFHDSLLPRYRGFAPTVTALINGDPEIGVTALHLHPRVDAGPILAQTVIPVTYPMKIARALELQAKAMARLALEIIDDMAAGRLIPRPQDERRASYSLWRDSADYEIDWRRSAEEIRRLIDAVGPPYSGARSRVDGSTVIIDDATVVDDLRFERRDVGKVWRLEDRQPVVVCGEGLLRIDRMRTLDGADFAPPRLRVRFGGVSR